MQEITKEKLKTIVSSLMLKPTEEVLNQIIQEWSEIKNNLAYLDKIPNLEKYKPLSHIDEDLKVDFFREDVVDNSFAITKKEILENSKNHDDDFIITTKVVK